MSTTFSLYKPLTPPQSITHACHASFLGPNSNDLIVIRNNFIEIMTLPHGTATPSPTMIQPITIAQTNESKGITDQTVLQRRFEAPLFGNVEGVWSVNRANTHHQQ